MRFLADKSAHALVNSFGMTTRMSFRQSDTGATVYPDFSGRNLKSSYHQITR